MMAKDVERRTYKIAVIDRPMANDEKVIGGHVGSLEYRVNHQISIISAISIALSTSMQR